MFQTNWFPQLSSNKTCVTRFSPEGCHLRGLSNVPPRFRFGLAAGCSFGASCKRANPQHFLDESHPGDPDFGAGGPGSSESGTRRLWEMGFLGAKGVGE